MHTECPNAVANAGPEADDCGVTRDEMIFYGTSAAASAVILYCLWRWNVVRPASFPEKSGRDVSGAPAVIWLLGALMMFLGQAEGVILASRLPERVIGAAKSLQQTALVSVAGHLVGLLVAAGLFWLLRGRVSEKAGLNWKWSDIGRGAVAMVIVAPIYICVAYAASEAARLVNGAAPDKLAHEGLKEIIGHRESLWAWVMMGTAVFGAPLVEESMYRVFLQSCLLRAIGRTWPAVFITSALFAGVHWGTVPAHALAPLFVVGLAFGVAYERTRSPLVPITMHALFNAGNLVVAILAGV